MNPNPKKDPLFKPIHTGQTFPDGIDLHSGQCRQCGRKGNVASILLTLGMMEDQRPMCAECMADFLAGAQLFGAKVLGKTAGEWEEIAIQKPPRGR